jgi:hypothetical protein
MKQTIIKYFSIALLLLLFIFKGVISILPLYSDFFYTEEKQEIRMNSQSENTEENNNEKRIEVKEFLGHLYNDHNLSIQYALLSKSISSRENQFATNVFLPVNTPPPKYID